MRRQIMEALTYPKLLVRQMIEDGNFEHKNLFEATGERCHHCDPNHDCGWEHCLQDFRDFDSETTEGLSDCLREGIRLVESLHRKLRHDETTCTCETCCWIRHAEHLTEECEHHLPHVDPGIAAPAS